LQALLPHFPSCALIRRQNAASDTLTTHVQVRLSTLRYFEQKFAVIHGNETPYFGARYRDASFLQLSKIVSRFQLLSGSPLPAERSIDLEPMLRVQIKNPAPSAGHVRPFAGAPFTRAPSRTDMLEARCSKSRCS
jgi:hypothetical protein